MAKLEYTFKNDTLFKSVFVEYPDLLKRLVAELLAISFDSIEEFEITNSDIPPDMVSEKFCRLDINMRVNGQVVDLEIQVDNRGDYPERSLYYWSREFSSSLKEGEDYKELPKTIIVSIIAFKLFPCAELHSEFQPLEVTRHDPLTDKQVLHYFELPKLPKEISVDDELKLWLTLFNAETEEEIKRIEEMGVQVMKDAILAYRHVSASDKFKELERMRSRARHNEASALRYAVEVEREKWQNVIEEKDTALAAKDAQIAELLSQLERRA